MSVYNGFTSGYACQPEIDVDDVYFTVVRGSVLGQHSPVNTGEDDLPNEPLLPNVNVVRLSEDARREFTGLMSEAFREVLEEWSRKKPRLTPGALKAADAATYVGVSRSGFYQLLKNDPTLLKLSFSAGRSRRWSTSALDKWMQARQAQAV
jgi:predicted DNA-binding transcriptional regulator AlpA